MEHGMGKAGEERKERRWRRRGSCRRRGAEPGDELRARLSLQGPGDRDPASSSRSAVPGNVQSMCLRPVTRE